jgi:hypothetical protein
MLVSAVGQKAASKGITPITPSRSKSSGFAPVITSLLIVAETRPDRPTLARLKKLIALADDARGEPMTRRAAKRKLALYARFYPTLLRVKDDHRKDR